MTSPATVALLAVAAAAAVGDWVAVGFGLRRVEFAFKPAVLALLVAAAATADLGPEKPWVVVALALGLAGDVGLLLAAPDRLTVPFLAGLGAFLVGHGFWIVAFVRRGLHPLPAVAGVLVALGVAGLVLRPVLRAVHTEGGRPLTAVVALYVLVLAAMSVLAVSTGLALVAAGGVAFLVSDAVLAHDRFVRPVRRGHLVVMITYHAAQFLLLTGLLRHG
ncbi:lysoplasmalogenase [Jatrophihabitans endophyticus]|uniref:lysoplasmalogenase n=1 Tax=Jatrophihabitans endophyticus TaxID=1206085 RepID=UPI0019E5E8B5|nr:lysoplasmalogenase [Jatrophihabitans endophyticus]MBE7188039.1 lysoplasmalogenase [Jatrophihabitans endophyticus]